MPTILSIQYLRAVAALGVVLFHLAWNTGRWFDAGMGGVDLFFVISGFIMWTISREAESRPAMFLWRRLARIAPLYWAVTLATFAIATVIPRYFHHMVPGDPEHLLWSLAFLPQTNPARGEVLPTVPMGWTLNVEMFFYIAVGLSLLLPRRVQFWTLCVGLVALAAAGALLGDATPFHTSYLNIRMLEFAAGLALGSLWRSDSLPSGPAGAALLAIGVAGFFLMTPLIAAADLSWLRPREAPLAAFGLPSVLIVAGALSLERAGSAPNLPWLKLLGDASFALYLTHDIVLHATMRAPLPVALQVAVSIAAIIAVAVAVHRLFERPAAAWLRRAARSRALRPEIAEPPA